MVLQILRRAGGVRGLGSLARETPRYLNLTRRLVADSRVPASAKAILLGAGAYAVSPINIPAFIPVIGVLDEVGVALIAWNFFIKRVPPHVLREHRIAVGLPPEETLIP